MVDKKRIAITGLGFITPIGNSRQDVIQSLKQSRSGIKKCELFDDPKIPISLAGLVEGFSFPSISYDEWTFPEGVSFRRDQLRSMAPNIVFGHLSMQQAIEDAGLSEQEISNPRTSLMAASTGSQWMSHETLSRIDQRGVRTASPVCVCYSISGSLNINLAANFKIKGGMLGFSSACASSAHAFGTASDLIALGRQDRVFVVGAEEVSREAIVPFAAARALSLKDDPEAYPCPFDSKRDGFIACEGGVTMVLENLNVAQARGAKIYAEVLGWGQSSDGYNVVIPEPEGEGLARAMQLALEESAISSSEVDYINAHATSTLAGDEAEARAIDRVFGQSGDAPYISSTKALTGHGLHLAGVMEASFGCLSIDEKFMPVSAKITDLDPKFENLNIVREPSQVRPEVVMSSSSGFGGTNVSLVMRRYSPDS
ncbi:MAG: beta-ketoacyl-[acyl-carrier-protein] synthase family protein [Verrucomicrobiota bacterium]